MTKISLVVPILNEESMVPLFYETVRGYAPLADFEVEIVFVNDGSTDATSAIIADLAVRDPLVLAVDLTRNFGKEPALFAGLARASGDAVVPMDVDLQDPIEVIPRMIALWQGGADIVLARRIDRSADSWAKRSTARMFYAVHNRISKPRIENNVGDFRLISREILDHILRMPERNLFMKGILSWVGGTIAIVDYERAARVAGSTKFNGWKLWNLALEGITSFSTVPLRIWSYIGVLISFSAIAYAIWVAAGKFFFGNTVPGYPSLMTAVMFFGGIQIIGIGIIGEYIGRIYIETKQRPRYLVRQSPPRMAAPAALSSDGAPPAPAGRDPSLSGVSPMSPSASSAPPLPAPSATAPSEAAAPQPPAPLSSAPGQQAAVAAARPAGAQRDAGPALGGGSAA